MSSFFTLPASQKKRKRTQNNNGPRTPDKRAPKARRTGDESISGSDVSDDEMPARGETEQYDGSETEEDDLVDEDPAAKRIRLAEQYLANTQKEVLDEVGFDAADIDAENLRQRMGERLKEDTAETRGKVYRWIAEDFSWSKGKSVQFKHHQKALTGVAVAGEYAYTVGNDSILVKWRLPGVAESANEWPPRSRKPQRILTSRPIGKNTNSKKPDHHTKAILCVAASQDGKFVATGGADKKLIVWDAGTLRPLRVFPQHRDSVVSLAFRRGTNQLFSASKDRTIKIWSLDELAYVDTLFGHQDEVVDVSALAQEQCVTVGARDRTARLWKVVEETQLVFRGGGAPKSKQHRLHDSDNGIEILDDDMPHEGSTDRVTCIDDETFVTGSDSGCLSLWNINKKKAIDMYPLAHGFDPPLPLDQVSAEEHPPEQARTKPLARGITALRAIPFSNIFVTGSWDGYIRVWKISPDRRRIETLGRIESTRNLVQERFGLKHDRGNDGVGKENSRIEGIINDLAIIDQGSRSKNRVTILAAVGPVHRLGRWKEIPNAKSFATMVEIPLRDEGAGESDVHEKAEAEADADADADGFAGFD